MSDNLEPLCVELHMAFMWDCPECGVENFQRSVAVHMTDEELSESDCPPENFEMFRTGYLSPKTVKCRDCGKRFKAHNEGDDGADK